MQCFNRRQWIGGATATAVALWASRAVHAAAAGAASYRVLVTNEHSGTLSVIDGATKSVVATIPLGKRPRGLKASPDGKLLYVALSGSPIAGPGVDESTLPPADKGADGIGIVDLTSLKLLRVLRGVSDPEQLAVGRDGRHLYVASEDTGRGVVLNASDGSVVTSVEVGDEPEGVSLSPDGRFVYITSEEDHKVTVIDTATNSVVAAIEVGQRPRFTEFSDDGRIAYVSGENDGTITVIDTATHRKLRSLKLTGELARPVGMVVSHDGKLLYTVTGRGQKLLALNPETGAVVSSVDVGPRPWGVALSPDGKTLYTANGSSNDVSVVDAQSFSVTSRIAVGGSPWGLIIV
ncbi:MAG: beta-propeller fold lactonase family protein [Nevskiaceae bacterium]|jgi:YVTN family beta-propeller protein|nr:beta-propeller fold lactonase family protein [Nevskiaceae bacterium]